MVSSAISMSIPSNPSSILLLKVWEITVHKYKPSVNSQDTCLQSYFAALITTYWLCKTTLLPLQCSVLINYSFLVHWFIKYRNTPLEGTCLHYYVIQF